MQVKKFEAKSMKEALEMVKSQLGPEAIILSAKDSHRGFGLIGEKSVEVTAAVSDETLRRKKLAETKLRDDVRERFQQIPASKQKQFINKSHAQAELVALATAGGGITVERPAPSNTRYIDIEDEQPQAYTRARTAHPPPAQRTVPDAATRSARVNAAAAAATSAARANFTAPPAQLSVATASENKNPHVQALENQVRELKSLVERFQSMPQMPMTMHPGAEQGLSYEMSSMYQRLTSQGTQPSLAARILKQAQTEMSSEAQKNPAQVDAFVARSILHNIKVSGSPSDSRYHIFLGSTAQGKTTTLVKLASHLMMKERRTIAIISLDTVKLGAADQLRLYAQILNVPFATVRNPAEWQVAEQKLANVQHILVDCPGFSLHSPQEVEWLKRMLPGGDSTRATHFVQSVLSREEIVAERYHKAFNFDDVIFTRLDESARRGTLLNFQDRFQVPIHSFAFGSRIPEDFELAKPERVLDYVFNLQSTSAQKENA